MQTYNNFGGLKPHEMPYVMLRGWALQLLMMEIFKRPDWVDLRQMTPKAFERLLLDMACRTECDVTPTFVLENPEAIAWIAKCYRILFKCLIHDWRMDKVLMVEPQLPNILIPDGREINCGAPDIFGDSETFGGYINIELKSGQRRVGRDGAKLARYNSGARLLAEDQGIQRPFIGTIWITFASKKQDPLHKHYYWSAEPGVSFHFEPFNLKLIDESLQRKFGLDLQTASSLPRHYNPRPAFAG